MIKPLKASEVRKDGWYSQIAIGTDPSHGQLSLAFLFEFKEGTWTAEPGHRVDLEPNELVFGPIDIEGLRKYAKSKTA